MTFKYVLDKSSRKFICPSCGKRRFVKFVDVMTNEYLKGNYGKCDRSDNCAFKNYPRIGKRFFKIITKKIIDYSSKSYQITDTNFNSYYIPKSVILEIDQNGVWINEFYLKKSSISYNDLESKVKNDEGEIFSIIAKTGLTEPKPSYHNLELLENIVNSEDDCNLSFYLKSKFDPVEVRETMMKYNVGRTDNFWKASTCFFQVDSISKIRAGKVMLYSKYTGKRIKKPRPLINWMHNTLVEKKSFVLKQCLFGIHLVKSEAENKTIAIVESEKTAIIMSMADKSCLWLACGSKTAINEKMLKSLKSQSLLLFPDKGSLEDWEARAKNLCNLGFRVRVSPILENKNNLKLGDDIADLFLKKLA
ncbi:MAG: DUF6371 domain-containing protein [Maribacter sp.]